MYTPIKEYHIQESNLYTNKTSTIYGNIIVERPSRTSKHFLRHYNLQPQCLSKARTEKSRELAIKAVDTGKENAAPASGEGAGVKPRS